MNVLLMIGFLCASAGARAALAQSSPTGSGRRRLQPPRSRVLDELLSSGENLRSTTLDYGGKHPFERRRRQEEVQQEELEYSNREEYETLRMQFITDPIEAIRSSDNDSKVTLVLETVSAVRATWLQKQHCGMHNI